MALTTKQKLFVQHYLESYNATQAAIRAGYSEAAARTSGYKNMQNGDIRAEVTRYVELVAMGAAERLITLSDIARDKEERTGDRLKAIELLGKLAGDYTERVQYQAVDLSELSDAELEAIVGGGKV